MVLAMLSNFVQTRDTKEVCGATAPKEVGLKISSQTAISAKTVDDRSNETTLIVVGLKDEIIAIPRDNIALVVMGSTRPGSTSPRSPPSRGTLVSPVRRRPKRAASQRPTRWAERPLGRRRTCTSDRVTK